MQIHHMPWMDTVPVFKVTMHDLIVIKSLGGSTKLDTLDQLCAADVANKAIRKLLTH